MPCIALGGGPAGGLAIDRWTAVLPLFHDHDWEAAVLPSALASSAFYIGAQGGFKAREARKVGLAQQGWGAADIARVRSPIALIPRARDPETRALSALAEIVAGYEALHPHG